MKKPLSSPLVFFLLLSLFLAQALSSEETLSPITSEQSNKTTAASTENLPTLDELFQTLEDEATAQYEDSKQQSKELESSKTEAEGFSSSLNKLNSRYESLTQAVAAERQEALDRILAAEKKRLKSEQEKALWQKVGIAGIAVSVAEAVIIGAMVAMH